MSMFLPYIEGTLEVGRVPEDLVGAIRRRVENGLLQPGVRRRANYVVRREAKGAIDFGAADWWTALAIGLNEVQVRRLSEGRLAYSITFWRWAGYVIGLGAILGAALIGSMLFEYVRRQVAEQGGLIVFLAIVLFWAVVWPWILIAIHRRVVRKQLERILRQLVEAEAIRRS